MASYCVFLWQLASLHQMYAKPEVTGDASGDVVNIPELKDSRHQAENHGPTKQDFRDGEVPVVIENMHGHQGQSGVEAGDQVSNMTGN